jgi:hypothetical protein
MLDSFVVASTEGLHKDIDQMSLRVRELEGASSQVSLFQEVHNHRGYQMRFERPIKNIPQ